MRCLRSHFQSCTAALRLPPSSRRSSNSRRADPSGGPETLAVCHQSSAQRNVFLPRPGTPPRRRREDAFMIVIGSTSRLLAATISAAASLLGPEPAARLGDADPNVEIREAGGGRGRGAFATQPLPAGAYLGRYTGRLLTVPEATERLELGLTSGEPPGCTVQAASKGCCALPQPPTHRCPRAVVTQASTLPPWTFPIPGRCRPSSWMPRT